MYSQNLALSAWIFRDPLTNMNSITKNEACPSPLSKGGKASLFAKLSAGFKLPKASHHGRWWRVDIPLRTRCSVEFVLNDGGHSGSAIHGSKRFRDHFQLEEGSWPLAFLRLGQPPQ